MRGFLLVIGHADNQLLKVKAISYHFANYIAVDLFEMNVLICSVYQWHFELHLTTFYVWNCENVGNQIGKNSENRTLKVKFIRIEYYKIIEH